MAWHTLWTAHRRLPAVQVAAWLKSRSRNKLPGVPGQRKLRTTKVEDLLERLGRHPSSEQATGLERTFGRRITGGCITGRGAPSPGTRVAKLGGES